VVRAGVPREVRLYLCRDEKSSAMLEAFRRELNRLPKEERPKIRVNLLRLRDPSRFDAYLKELEELFGGIYVQEFKKYGIKAVPAVVVDGEKVAEGRYLSEEEIRSLLGIPPPPAPQPPPMPAQPAGSSTAPQPRAPVELAPVELAPLEERPPEPRREPEVELPPVELEPEAPVLLEPPTPPKPPEGPKPARAPAPPAARPPAPPRPEAPPAPRPPAPAPQPQPAAPPRLEAAPAAKPQAAEEVKPARPASKASCHGCVYFDSSRSRCRLHHIVVQDPGNPPCGRGRR
jgi:hypothetical protein